MSDYLRSLCALILLAALAGCGRGVDLSVVDPYDVLHEKLQRIVSVDWDNLPLEQALQELAEQSGVAIRIDAAKLAEANVRPSEPVTLHLRGVRLRSALHLFFDDLGLGYVCADDGITATSREVSDTSSVGRLYPVADIAREQASFDEEKLAEVIKGIIRPETWEDDGGSGKIEHQPGALFIEQRCDIHDEIADLLADLRSPREAEELPPSGERTAAMAAIYKALETRVTIDLNRAPGEVLDQIATQHGINLVVRWKKLVEANAEGKFRAPASKDGNGPILLKDVSLQTALDLMLEPLGLGLGWVVRNDALVITSREEAVTALSVQSYPVPSGIDTRPVRRSGFSGAYVSGGFSIGPVTWVANDMEELLEQAVQADSWKNAGGPGSWAPIPVGRMMVAQSEHGHEEVANWLRELRRAAGPRVVDYDERATSPQAEQLWQALDRPVTIDLRGSVRIGRGIRELLGQYGVPNVAVEFKKLEEANVQPDDWLPVLHLKNVSLAAALDALLAPLGLGWYTRDNVLVVTSKEKADTTIVNLAYRCPCLADGSTNGMIELVTTNVRADSWKEAGGPGSVEFVFGNVLSVSQTWRVHRELRHFLREWHAAQDATASASIAASPAEQKVHAALERSVTFAGKEQPLMAAVAEFADHCGVENVVWQWNSIAQHEDDRFEQKLRMGEFRAKITTDGQVAADVLTGVLAAHDLVWAIEHDALCVRYEKDELPTPLITSFYRVPAIVKAIGDDPETLIEVVTSHLQPDSWKEAGGPGTIDVASGKILVVSQSWLLQHQLRLFLRQWEASVGPAGGVSPALVLSPTERRLLEAMEGHICYSCDDRPLMTAVAELTQRAGVKEVWDWPAIEAQIQSGAISDCDLCDKLRSGSLRATIQAADEPAGDVLTRLLQPHGLSWTVKHDSLCVTCESEQPHLITGFYRLPQGVAMTLEVADSLGLIELPRLTPFSPNDDPFGVPVASRARSYLADWLQELLAPDSWRENGGNGQVDIVYLSGGKGLSVIITHTLSIHRQAGRLLGGWRQTPRVPEEVRKLLRIPPEKKVPRRDRSKPFIGTLVPPVVG